MVGSRSEVTTDLEANGPDRPRRRSHRLPIGCYSVSEREFLFTLCARHRGQPFADATLAEVLVDALLWRRQHHGWTLYAYCLMPDHLHFVVRLPDGEAPLVNAGVRGRAPEGVLDHVARYKRYTTTQVWWKHGGCGPLWQRSSYDRVIRYNESPEDAIRYVLENPVRKGLVQDWQDYPYARVVDPW
jgi:REP element-mobilizing transposase RayT